MTQTQLTEKRNRTKDLVLAALCLAIALLLPFLTGQIQSIGKMLCPMHLPVLLCAYICGWQWAAAVGAVSPLLRYALFGMPPIMPVGVAMAFELLTYGLVAGLLYKMLPKKTGNIYLSLITAMVAGRIVWGIVSLIIAGATSGAFGWQMFINGAVLTAIPGIILQIVVIPVLVIALKKAKLIA